jgi:hypothetical protein
MIRVQKTLILIQDPQTTRAENRGGKVQHLQGRGDIVATIRGHLDGTPATGAAIVGRLRVKTMNGRMTLIAAAGPADTTGSERAARRRPGRVRQHGGAGHPPDGISGETEGQRTDGMIIDGDETFV